MVVTRFSAGDQTRLPVAGPEPAPMEGHEPHPTQALNVCTVKGVIFTTSSEVADLYFLIFGVAI
jgi:hypothetical protein